MIRRRPARPDLDVPRVPLALREVLHEATADILVRPGRAVLTVLGVLLGVGSFVVVLGLTTTVAGQIDKRFTAQAATEVQLEETASAALRGPAFPIDADARLAALNGVRAAGVFWQVSLGGEGGQGLIGAHPTYTDSSEHTDSYRVVAASPGYLSAIRAKVGKGRLFDEFHERRAERVVLLGASIADRLGVGPLDVQPVVFIAGQPMTVLGIIDDVHRHAEVLTSAIVPDTTATRLWGGPDYDLARPRMLVDTRLGAAELIGRQAPYALRPEDPHRFRVVVPPDPQRLRAQVDTDLYTLFLTLAGVCLVVGMLGIANMTLVSVLERVGEIGLRRAIGALRRHVALQFLSESALLGLFGGFLGTAVGVVAVVVVASTQRWTPILEPAAVLPAPVVGALVGLVAGLYPSWQASRIEPAEALRH